MNRKSNIRLAFSLVGSILIATLFCLIVFLSLAVVLTNTLGIVLIQVINLLIFVAMVYVPLWNIGEKDINYVLTKHIEYDKYSGLKIGLMAMTLLYLPAILLVVAKFLQNQILLSVYRLLNVEFFGLLQVLVPLQVADVGWLSVLCTFLLPLIVPAVAALAYYLGYRRISLTGKLIYKNKKKK